MAMLSELLRLSSEERVELAEATCRFGRARGAVIISVGAESSKVSERFARQAESAGADAVMAKPPVSVGVGENKYPPRQRSKFLISVQFSNTTSRCYSR